MKWAPRLHLSLSATEFRRSWVSKNVAESISATFSHRPGSIEFEAGRQNGRYNSTKSPRAIPSDAAKYHGQGPRKSRSDEFLGLARRYM